MLSPARGKVWESGLELWKRADSVVGGYGGQEGRSLVLSGALLRTFPIQPVLQRI